MNTKKLKAMEQGGRLLAGVRDALIAAVKPGITPLEIDALADTLISQTGGQAAFKKVPKYHYATCINVNSVIVHGIPTSAPVKDGDMVSIDVGLYYQGYYTDTSATTVVGIATPFQVRFLQTGLDALKAGISKARAGNHVSDISKAIEKVITAAGFTPIRELTGHGVGKHLHEDPFVPNIYDPYAPDPVLYLGQTLAIEPMYSAGSAKLRFEPDGWTISMADNSVAALIEETIAITPRGPRILTASS